MEVIFFHFSAIIILHKSLFTFKRMRKWINAASVWKPWSRRTNSTLIHRRVRVAVRYAGAGSRSTFR